MNNKKYANSYYEFRRIRDLRELIFTSCELYGDEVAYLEKNKFRKVFEGITYKEVKKHVIALGNAFANMGLVGEKIAIAGETSYSWILTYFATVCGVGTVVPLDKNLPTEELINLINRSKSSCLAYGKKIEGELEEILAKCPAVKHLIRLDAYNKLEGGEDARHGEVQEVSNQSIWWLVREGEELVGRQGNALENLDIDPDNMAVLMFTSGTTGRAKGVMLSQRNIAFNVYAMSKNFQIPKNGVVLSILPIHHAYEMTCDIWTTFYQGKTIAICEGIKYIQKNMQEVKANVMLGVPLVFEKMYKGMWKQAEKRGEAEKLRRAIALSKKLKLYNNPKVIKKTL